MFFIFCFVLAILMFTLHIYGAILCFKKKWYIGLAALVFGIFGITVGAAKLFFKTDLVK